jgi:hypothetical protein
MCNETFFGGGFSKFSTRASLLTHVEYALTPAIIGAGATFPQEPPPAVVRNISDLGAL